MKKSAFITMLLLVTVMLTGCFFDFGPAKATTPNIAIKNNDIGLIEPLEFTILNWNGELEYRVSIDGNKVLYTNDGSSFKVTNAEKWTAGEHVLLVSISDSEGTVKEASDKFIARSKGNIFTVEMKNKSTAVFNIFIEQETKKGMTVLGKVWLNVNGKSEEHLFNETIAKDGQFKISKEISSKENVSIYPEIKYDLSLQNPGSDATHENGTISCDMNIGPITEGGKPGPNDKYPGFKGWSYYFETDDRTDYRNLDIRVKIRGDHGSGTITATSAVVTEQKFEDFLDRYYVTFYIKDLFRFDNEVRFEISYPSIAGTGKTGTIVTDWARIF